MRSLCMGTVRSTRVESCRWGSQSAIGQRTLLHSQRPCSWFSLASAKPGLCRCTVRREWYRGLLTVLTVTFLGAFVVSGSWRSWWSQFLQLALVGNTGLITQLDSVTTPTE